MDKPVIGTLIGGAEPTDPDQLGGDDEEQSYGQADEPGSVFTDIEAAVDKLTVDSTNEQRDAVYDKLNTILDGIHAELEDDPTMEERLLDEMYKLVGVVLQFSVNTVQNSI